MIGWGIVAAWGADPGPEPVLEVIVAEQRLSTAKEHVVRELNDQGYLRLVRFGHRSYWINRQPWKPWVMVHDEGFARVRGVVALPIGLGHPSPPSTSAPVAEWDVAEVTFLTQSRRLRMSQRERLAERLEPALSEVREARWDLAFADRLQARAERLVAIWHDPTASPAARRAAIVAEWLNTEPDDAGASVRALIERYIDDEVQPTHPFTPQEVAAANAARKWPAPLEPVDPQ